MPDGNWGPGASSASPAAVRKVSSRPPGKASNARIASNASNATNLVRSPRKSDSTRPSKKIRFLLVSQPRMGSTWVGSKIASHPCSNWRGENGMSSWSGKPGGTPKPCHLEKGTATDKCLEDYFEQKQSSVVHQESCALDPPVRLVGGKVWGSNMLPKTDPKNPAAKKVSPATLAYMRRHSVHVVWVMRTNVLDRQISNQYVKNTNSGFVMHCFVNGSKWKQAQAVKASKLSSRDLKKLKNPCLDRPDIRVQINTADVLKDLEQENLLFKQLGTSFGIPAHVDRHEMHVSTERGFPVLYMPYESLVADPSLWLTVAEFLGLPRAEGQHFQDRTKKRVTKTQREVIANYEEVARDLRAAGFAYLLT